MKIIVDSREQRRLRFPLDHIVTAVKVEAMPVGDYWCEYEDGSRPPIVFERKSLGDLFGTMAGGYPRFKQEIERATARGWRLIIIVEEPLSAVYDGYSYSMMNGDSCVQKLFTLWLKYNVMPVFCNSRYEAVAYIRELYEAVGRCWKLGDTGKQDEADEKES